MLLLLVTLLVCLEKSRGRVGVDLGLARDTRADGRVRKIWDD